MDSETSTQVIGKHRTYINDSDTGLDRPTADLARDLRLFIVQFHHEAVDDCGMSLTNFLDSFLRSIRSGN